MRERLSEFFERLELTAQAVAAAILCGIALAWVSARLLPPVATAVGGNRAVGQAANVLETLPVRGSESSKRSGGSKKVERSTDAASGSAPARASPQYQRQAFGYQTVDADGDGCFIREEILARDLTAVHFSQGSTCQVKSGILKDPYTGTTIHFVRGARTSSKVQIDHVVALHDAWRSGASQWDSAKLLAYGNDPYNLLAVQGAANEEKSDASAAYWLPSNRGFRCAYVARQIGVKAKYGLSVSQREKEAMTRVLQGCPGQTIPADRGNSQHP